MTDPLIWGLLTFALEFIPFLGGAVMVVLLSISALSAYPNLGSALLVPASYLLISAIQNNLVTPLLLGGRLKLNPVALMIGVLFWWFIWESRRLSRDPITATSRP
jgi:predicted PurR-regulated permease PerM